MREMDRHQDNEHSSPASANNKGDAALEFIKHICAVLALDQNVQHDILVMLYRIMNFHELPFNCVVIFLLHMCFC